MTTNGQALGLTPAEIGSIAATLDACVGKGDDETVDQVFLTILEEGIDAGGRGYGLAYQIVHDHKREI